MPLFSEHFSYFIVFENVIKNLPQMPSLIGLAILSYINDKSYINIIANMVGFFFVSTFLRNGQGVRICPLFCDFSQTVIICCLLEHVKLTDM